MDGFRRETIVAGSETVTEYGVFHPGRGDWLSFNDDGAACFVREPKPLSAIFPPRKNKDNPDPGTEEFAFRLLDWVNETAGTGELKSGKWYVPLEPWQVKDCGVFSFEYSRTLVMETEVEVRLLRSKDTLFEVRGPKPEVDQWVDTYLGKYPKSAYSTTVTDHLCKKGDRLVRIWRRTLNQTNLPWGSVA